MAKKFTSTDSINATPDKVVEVLASEDFIIANQKMRDAVSATVREVSRTDSRLVIEINTTEYAKGITGIDRSKTEETMTTEEWDLKARSKSWTYKGSHRNVQVWGNTRIQEAGGGSSMVSEFNVEVKIPLVGGKVEKLVIKEVEKTWPRYISLVQEYCAK